LNPLPVLLILDPSGLSASHADALPIKVYESIPSAGVVDVGEVEFRLETGEAERIGVEHVSKAQQKSDGGRTDADECISLFSLNMLIIVVSVLQTQASAIRMLQARIETIKEYLVDVQEGTVLIVPKLM
jgi:Maintenance of mitochondrial structure and function